MTDKILFSNNGVTTITVGISAIATSIQVSSGAVFQAPSANEYQLMVIMPAGTSAIDLAYADVEIVKCTANAADTLTVTRGQESSVAKVWPAGSVIAAVLTEGIMNQVPQGFDLTGDTTGTNAVELQSGRATTDRVASGQEAVTVGYSNKAASPRGVAIGYNNTTSSSGVSIGDDNSESAGVAIGDDNVLSSLRSIGIGRNNRAPTTDRTAGIETIQIGGFQRNAIENGVRIAGVPFVMLPEWPEGFNNAGDVTDLRYVVGREITVVSHPVGIGNGPAWPTSTLVAHGEVIVDGSYSYFAYSYPTDYWASQTTGAVEPTWPTTPQDSVNDVTNLDWVCMDPTEVVYLMPNYTRFIPIAVGFITDKDSGALTVDPVIQFGSATGTPSDWLEGTTFTNISGAYKREEHLVVEEPTASKILVAGMTTAATGNCTGRFFWRGIVVETMES